MATRQRRRLGVSRRSRFTALSAVSAVVFALVAACGGGSKDESSSSDVDASKVQAPILDTLHGDQRTGVAKLIAQAQTEGELNFVTPIITTSKAPLIKEFKRLYNLPDLKVNFENLESTETTSRIQSEVQSGQIKTDVVGVDGSPSFWRALKEADALVYRESPELDAYKDTDQYVDDDFGYWTSPIAIQYAAIYDPKTWPDGISSWKDLLDPRLKGRFSFPGVPDSESALYTYYGLRKQLDKSYFESLAANEPRVGVGNSTVATQMVAEGELLVAITSSHTTHVTSQTLGVPLEVSFPEEGVVEIGWSVGVLKDSPNPATAKLFLDFLLSEDGVQIMVDHEAVTPARDDITIPEELHQFTPRSLDAAHAIPVNADVDRQTLDEYRQEFNDIFGT